MAQHKHRVRITQRVRRASLSIRSCVVGGGKTISPLASGSGRLTSHLNICALAIVTEALIGYPQPLFRVLGHPVSWIGALIAALDRSFNRPRDAPGIRRVAGGLTLVVVLAASGFPALVVARGAAALLPHIAALVLLSVLASSCLAQRSLDSHVRAVAEALETEGLPAARHAVGAIVGRDTRALDESGVARAAIESLAENFADGIVAPALWIAILGLPGGVLYKAVNTADSMIGHRTPRHAAFGFCAAKLDDLVNWPAARLAAGLIVMAAALASDASWREAWRILRRDARGHPSPNAGWPEAAMAGALGMRLGGPRLYAGHRVDDAFIGDGLRRPDAAAIRVALRIYRIACGLQFAVVLIATVLIARWR